MKVHFAWNTESCSLWQKLSELIINSHASEVVGALDLHKWAVNVILYSNENQLREINNSREFYTVLIKIDEITQNTESELDKLKVEIKNELNAQVLDNISFDKISNIYTDIWFSISSAGSISLEYQWKATELAKGESYIFAHFCREPFIEFDRTLFWKLAASNSTEALFSKLSTKLSKLGIKFEAPVRSSKTYRLYFSNETSKEHKEVNIQNTNLSYDSAKHLWYKKWTLTPLNTAALTPAENQLLICLIKNHWKHNSKELITNECQLISKDSIETLVRNIRINFKQKEIITTKRNTWYQINPDFLK